MFNEIEKKDVEERIKSILKPNKYFKIEVAEGSPQGRLQSNIFIDFADPTEYRPSKRSNKLTLRFSEEVQRLDALKIIKDKHFASRLKVVFKNFDFENKEKDGRTQTIFIICSNGEINLAEGNHERY